MNFLKKLFGQKTLTQDVLVLENYYQDNHFPKVASLADIYYCFRLILGRNPNPEECRGHSGMSGVDLDKVVKSYVQSVEFQNRNLLVSQAQNIAERQIEGFRIYVDLDDHAVGVHMANASYEPHVTSIFKQYVKPGMRVLDIGANIGYFSLLAASLVGDSGKVFAVEPNAENCKLLEASKKLNSYAQISVLQFAAGRSCGLLSLNTSYSNGTTSTLSDDMTLLRASRTVAAMKLDDYRGLDGGVDFIKIDIEGAEYNALFGARNLLERCKPSIISEFSPTAMPAISGVDGREYLKFLDTLAYDISVIALDGSLQHCGADHDKVMDAFVSSGVDHIDIFATPR
ncbi:FkbM family methyltransferase [Undibacterium sp. Tian12W]|uniref:FkbM family methyltransferase n=1 Tax=Undibacterium sp. Tian12W TaxID=3413054 RepID=UPI003BF0015B